MRVVFITIGLLVGSPVGLIAGAVAMHLIDSSPFFEPSPVNYQTIYFPVVNTKIYTVARIWGITDGHEEVRLCSEPYEFGKKDQTNQCVVFYTARIFYKKDGATGLKVFAPSFSISPNDKDTIGPIKISTKGLKNFEEIRNYEQNFENYGLMTIAAR
jgi:hypothetical protein